MWGYMNDYSMGTMGFGMSLFWILLIIGVVLLVKSSRNSRNSSGKTALDILKERYARGEIDKAEFDQKKNDLGS